MTKLEAAVLNCLQILLWALDRLLEIDRLSCQRERLSPGESRLVPLSQWAALRPDIQIDGPRLSEGSTVLTVMKASFPDYIDGIILEKVDGQQLEKTMPYGYWERNHRPQCRELE